MTEPTRCETTQLLFVGSVIKCNSCRSRAPELMNAAGQASLRCCGWTPQQLSAVKLGYSRWAFKGGSIKRVTNVV
jgi:hypothetical protein